MGILSGRMAGSSADVAGLGPGGAAPVGLGRPMLWKGADCGVGYGSGVGGGPLHLREHTGSGLASLDLLSDHLQAAAVQEDR